MRVPLAARSAVELNEAHASLDEPARHEAVRAEAVRQGAADAVEAFCRLRLSAQVHGCGGGGLHSEGQLVSINSRLQLQVVGSIAVVGAVQVADKVQLAALLRLAD